MSKRGKLARVRVLAVDTTTRRGSVAVVEGDAVLGEVRVLSPESHSRWVLSAVDCLLRSLELSPVALDGFAVTTGPGSFTGLRVGLSSIQGLALGTGRPCVGLPGLDVLAAEASGPGRTVVAMVDAWRDEVYAAVYRDGRLVGPRRVGAVASMLQGLSGLVLVVGDGASRYREDIVSALPDAQFPDVDLFLAARLGQLAVPVLAQGGGGGPESLRPLYLRGADLRKPAS
jgi:tRNA threonylcarbamoyladenosine biosynthesis protein TsaB